MSRTEYDVKDAEKVQEDTTEPFAIDWDAFNWQSIVRDYKALRCYGSIAEDCISDISRKFERQFTSQLRRKIAGK